MVASIERCFSGFDPFDEKNDAKPYDEYRPEYRTVCSDVSRGDFKGRIQKFVEEPHKVSIV